MTNYTLLNQKLLVELTNFIKNITDGLGKIKTHFICDMLNGIIANNSVILSDIARTSGSNNLKKTVERLERQLDSYDEISDIINTNYVNMVKPLLNNRKLYFMDGGDITKNENTKFENMGYVLDGSNSHTLSKGYKIFEIDTIDTSNQPLTLISDLMSTDRKVTDDNKELSETLEWTKRAEIITKTYGKGTFICDRGFDGAIFMEKIIETGSDFIVRAKSLDRNVYLKGEKTTISNIAKKCKGYYKFQSTINGKTMNLKVSSYSIMIKKNETKSLSKKTLTLIIVKGYGGTDAYMALLTSKNVCGKNETIQVVKDYLLRWRIEENFKFKKQQYGLEKIKVRRYKRIQIINKLLAIANLFNNILNLNAVGKTIRKIKKQVRKEIKIWLYRLTDGIKKIVSFTTQKIMTLLYPKPIPRRRDLFTVSGVRF